MIKELLKEKSVWEKLMATDKPIILYGMGDGADRVLNEFSVLNINISGVMASDGFVRGQTFHGFTVQTLDQVKEDFDNFIILITFGTDKPDVIEKIKELSKEYTVLVPSVPVAGEKIFNRGYLMRNGTEIMEAFNLMEDEKSREVFKNMCYFQYTGELEYLFAMESSKDDAYKILNLTSEENYLDLGAYRGDTIAEFLKYTCNRYKSITALEPDAKTYKKLVENMGELPNTKLIEKGIWNIDGEVCFATGKGRGSVLNNKEGVLTPVTCIDTIAKETPFTYVKMDVEGVEFVVLYGGYEYLQSNKPKLNVACYHRCCDIYRLPLMLKRVNPEYKIYMRHHPCIPSWETNLYCI